MDGEPGVEVGGTITGRLSVFRTPLDDGTAGVGLKARELPDPVTGPLIAADKMFCKLVGRLEGTLGAVGEI